MLQAAAVRAELEAPGAGGAHAMSGAPARSCHTYNCARFRACWCTCCGVWGDIVCAALSWMMGSVPMLLRSAVHARASLCGSGCSGSDVATRAPSAQAGAWGTTRQRSGRGWRTRRRGRGHRCMRSLGARGAGGGGLARVRCAAMFCHEGRLPSRVCHLICHKYILYLYLYILCC